MPTPPAGKCVNFGQCPTANKRQSIPIAAGDPNPLCPDCKEPLLISEPIVDRRRPAFIALGVIALLVLLGLGFAIRHLLGSGSAPSVAVAPSAPAAAASAQAAATAPAAASASPPLASGAALTLCGSNTIGSQLGPQLVRSFVSRDLGGSNARVGPGPGPNESIVRGDVAGRPDFHVDIAANGSATAFTGLASGACQIGMASRRAKPEEVRSLRGRGDLTSPAAEHVLGLDGIAVIVNPTNRVNGLGVFQLHGLFSGALTNWAQVGGPAGPVHIDARDDRSGTYDTFSALVLKDAHLAPSARRFADSAKLSDAVASDPNAIGFIGLPYVRHAKALSVASGTAGAIAPNASTVGRETYPLTRRLYLYTLAGPKNPLVDRFIAFAQSDAGQRVVGDAGFVGTLAAPPLGSHAVPVPADAPPQYANLLRTADQVDFDVYFMLDSGLLDNKARADIGRLVSLMNTDRYHGRKLAVAGFADNTGDPDYSRGLSLKRAQAVAAELASRGLGVGETFGFGQADPIGDNATHEGRVKNRRVEIFIIR